MSEARNKSVGVKDELNEIIQLRLAIGLLGEKDHANWWPSLWSTSNATSFLTPIYGERTDIARYHGLIEAARRVHDSRIGVGRVFHLFRLPEAWERRLHNAVTAQGMIGNAASIQTKEDAEALLTEIGNKVEASAGPIRVGSAGDLEGHAWLKTVAGHYLAAFRSSQQTFPYFAEAL
ncbi:MULTISPECIES: BrxE family protein [unclassified Mesorhizobium]|uniref:BrxE family protein n=1 Tax=unclassified Mesorhizobium TaxID=325217 RepID=UPI00241612BE|nr:MULTISPECIES: BrxE family protein [unclassified Mesorhizobium]MDG4901392.1 BrxE family protein [Mesorhizobium sp. WSM4962]MDG4918880.1 BrxE family protein [Mesorhizobium sp. WSM4989]